MKNIFRNNRVQKHKTIEDDFFFLGILLAIITAGSVLVAPFLPHTIQLPPCFFHLISGYYCPGCGGTRALRALCHGQFLQAVWFHPFVPYAASVYLYFMATQTIERISHGKFPIGMQYHNWIVWIAVTLIIGNFLIKNLLYYFYGLVL